MIKAILECVKDNQDSLISFVSFRGTLTTYSYHTLLKKITHHVKAIRSFLTYRSSDTESVVLCVDDPETLFLLSWAVMWLGKRLVLIPSSSSDITFLVGELDKQLKKPLFIFDEDAKGGIDDGLMTSSEALLADLDTFEFSEEVTCCSDEDGTITFFSSGSQGRMKPISLTYNQILSVVNTVKDRYRVVSNDRVLNPCPLTHVGAFKYGFLGFLVGCSQWHVHPQFVVTHPRRFLRVLDEQQITITWGPLSLCDVLCTAMLSSIEDLSLVSLRLWVCAGETIVWTAFEAFQEALLRFGMAHKGLCAAYGLTELSSGVTYSLPNNGRCLTIEGRSYVSCGKAIKGLSLKVQDDEGRAVQDGQEGLLYVKGETLFKGYGVLYDALDCSDFQLGWFCTGDTGFLFEDEWFPSGRKNGGFHSNGNTFDADDVIHVLEGVPGLSYSDVFVILDPHRSQLSAAGVCLIRNEPLGPNIKNDLNERFYQQFGAIPRFCLTAKRSDLPLTSLGKVAELHLWEWMLKQEVSEGAPIADNVSISQLQGVFQDVLSHPCDIATPLFELGLNSLFIPRIQDKIEAEFHQKVSVIDILSSATISDLAQRIMPDLLPVNVSRSVERISFLEGAHDIAVIGMEVSVPGAIDLNTFWARILAGEPQLERLSPEVLLKRGVPQSLIESPQYVPVCYSVPDLLSFDPDFFGYSDSDAMGIDPQQRRLLELGWLLLRQAGYSSGPDQSVGVFVSTGMNAYMNDHQLFPNLQGHFMGDLTRSSSDFAAARLSYKLNLKGPSFTVQTACSSSLVAVHQAAQSLRSGDCEMAIAGGVSYWNISEAGYLYQEGSIVSPDGVCRPFSSSANGTVFSNGGGLVLLKSLAKAREDGDAIWGVIKGSSVNNDGQSKPGFSVPSAITQAEAISQAVHRSGIEKGVIEYVELHGTGTLMGDPLEIEGLKRAMAQSPKQFSNCAIGSVKRVVGHLGVASGVVGFIKTVLSLAHGKIPSSPYLSDWNPDSDVSGVGIYAPKEPRSWTSSRPLAGVSSFGLGGTNAHVVLSQVEESLATAKSFHEKRDCFSTPFKRRSLSYSDRAPSESLGQLKTIAWAPVLDVRKRVLDDTIQLVYCQRPGRRVQLVKDLLGSEDVSFLSCDLRESGIEQVLGSQLVMVLEESDLEISFFLSFLKWVGQHNKPLMVTVLLPELTHVSMTIIGDLAATIGLIHSFRLENPVHHMCVIEGDVTSVPELAVFQDSSCWHVQLHKGRYFKRQLTELKPAEPERSLLASKKRYLVLGGTGRVGRVLCRHLVETYDAELVIVGRRSYEDVLSVLETITAADRISYIALDMTRESSFQTLVDYLVRTPVNGVFHLGMVHQLCAIQDLEMSQIHAHMGVKLVGAALLWHFIRTQKGVDFACFFSSGISLLPDMGVHRAAYLSATYAYDSLISHFLREGSTPVKLLNWGFWESSVRMDKAFTSQSDDLLETLSDDEALACFEASMASSLSQISILPVKKDSAKRGLGSIVSNITLHTLVSDVLKVPLEELDPKASFSDLGVGSLTALDLVVTINSHLDPRPPLRVQDMYRYSSISRLEGYLNAEAMERHKHEALSPQDEAFAIVGMACRFPGASSIQAYHQLLEQGQCAVKPISQTRFHNWVHSYGLDSSKVYGGFLSDCPSVDYAFFNLSPKDARVMDVRHGLFLEESYHALEDAGYSPLLLKHKRVGIFAGVEQSSVVLESEPFVGAGRLTGLSNSVLASRLAYHLDLDGPAIAVDTACSSSLVAIHQAILSLKQGDCDMAVAGGVSFLGSGYQHKLLQEAQLLSPSGRCASFDSASDGIVPSEGVGVVVLKPLSKAREDNDRVYGVVLSSKVNQDGQSNGLSAPNVDRQISLLNDMYSEIDPATISYIETHGTGTAIGDPIECDALASIKGFEDCAFGSVKPNVGHLLSASGMAGLIKLLLSLHHKRLFKTIHHDQLNPDIRLRKSSLFIQTDHVDWRGVQGRCRGAISNFGMSGTNVHMVLGEADSYLSNSPSSDQGVLIPLSAKSEESLLSYILQLSEFFGEVPHINIQDMAYTLMRRDGFYTHRRVFFVTSIEALQACLETGAISNLDVTTVPIEQRSVMRAYMESTLERWDLTKYSGRLCSLPGYSFMVPVSEDQDSALSCDPWQIVERISSSEWLIEMPLAGHKMYDKPLLSASTVLSLSLFVGEQVVLKQPLTDCRFHSPCFMDKGGMLRLRYHKDRLFFYYEGVCVAETFPADDIVLFDRPVFSAQHRVWDSTVVSAFFQAKGVLLDAPFNLIQEATFYEEGVCSRLMCDARYGYVSLIEGALQTIALAMKDPDLAENQGPGLINGFSIKGPLRSGAVYSLFAWQTEASHYAVVGVDDTNRQVFSCRTDHGVSISLPEQRVQTETMVSDDSVEMILKTMLSELQEYPISQIAMDVPIGQYGLDSIGFASLSDRIRERFDCAFEPHLFYDYQTLEQMVAYIVSQKPLVSACDKEDSEPSSHEPIAVVSISCRFPGGVTTPYAFWDLLKQETTLITEMPQSRPFASFDHTGTYYGGFLEDDHLTHFDSTFFGLSPKEVQMMDPQHRLLLELGWELVDSAGYSLASLKRSETGVYIAQSASDHLENQGKQFSASDPHYSFGVCSAMAANRLSAYFDLCGPSQPKNTACSSSLVALHQAMQAIRSGEIDQAIVGASHLILSAKGYEAFSSAGFLSQDGCCRPFSKDANGYVRSEGAVMVMLKPLSSAIANRDHIWGVLEGSTVRHTGMTHSLSSPSSETVSSVVSHLLSESQRGASSIDYIETHGTGTLLGDGAEIQGLKSVFVDLSCDVPCPIGSVKSHVGHNEGASGLTGLLTVLLGFYYDQLPVTRHVSQETLGMSLGQGLRISDEPSSWVRPKGDRAALVLSNGFGGTNGGLLVRDYVSIVKAVSFSKPVYLFVSALTDELLKGYLRSLKQVMLVETFSLSELACHFTANQHTFSSRRVFVAQSIEGFIESVETVLKNDCQDRVICCGSGLVLEDSLKDYLDSWVEGGALKGTFSVQYDGNRRWFPSRPLRQMVIDLDRSRLGGEDRSLSSLLQTEFKRALGLDSFDSSLTFRELGFNSIVLHELVEQLNTVQSIHKFSVDMFYDYTCLQSLIKGLETLSIPSPKAVEEYPVKPSVIKHDQGTEDVAIVGISCQFPQVQSVLDYGSFLYSNRSSITAFPKERQPDYDTYSMDVCDGPRYGGFLNGHDQFDRSFFCYSPLEAEWLEPQHRLILHHCWDAFQDAGVTDDFLKQRRVGVYLGAHQPNYTEEESHKWARLGSSASLLSARVSYFFNTNGPAFTVDTACSSSLVAIHQASEAVRRGECDIAISGGVSCLLYSPHFFGFLQDNRLVSSLGGCRTFSRDADGIVPAEGVGVIVLKRYADALADNDRIYGLIKGGSVEQDGKTGGLAAPSVTSQVALFQSAYDSVGLSPRDIQYLEAHGTGTVRGDKTELEALNTFWDGVPLRSLRLGSVKQQLGHTLAAGGVASLIKVLLSMRDGCFFPSFYTDRCHSLLEQSPFYMSSECDVWPGDVPRRAGISSFGMSGTNCHLIVEGVASPHYSQQKEGPSTDVLVCVSAHSKTVIKARIKALVSVLASVSFKDFVYTLNSRQMHLAHRVVFLVSTKETLLKAFQLYLESGQCAAEEQADCRFGEEDSYIVPKNSAAIDWHVLARHYVDGGWLDWSDYYEETSVHMVSLPPYPFDLKRLWKPQVEAISEIRESSVSLEGYQPLIADHCLYGQPVVPVAVSLAIFLNEVRRVPCRLEHVICLAPLRLDMGISLSVDNRALSLNEHGKQMCRCVVNDVRSTSSESIELSFFWEYPTLTHYGFYSLFGAYEITYGPLLRRVNTVWQGYDNEVLAQLDNQPEEGLSPALIDAALQLIICFRSTKDTVLYVPSKMGAVTLYNGGVPEFVLCRHLGAHSYSYYFLSSKGEVIASLTEVEFSPAVFETKPRLRAFVPVWDTYLPSKTTASSTDGCYFSQFSPLNESQVPVDYCHLISSDRALDISENCTVCNVYDGPGFQTHLERLIPRVQDGYQVIMDFHGDALHLDDIQTCFKDSYFFCQGLASYLKTGAIDIKLRCPDTPEGMMLFEMLSAFFISLQLEIKRFRWTGVLGNISLDDLRLLSEEGCFFSTGTGLKKRVFRPIMRNPSQPYYVKPGVTYLCIGGMGGIGLSLLASLVAQGATSIVCTGRSVLSQEQDRLIKSLQLSGCDVRYVRVDCCDRKGMMSLVSEIESSVAPLKGVFFLAGVIRDSLFVRMTEDAVSRILEPKFKGACLIDEITAELPLEIMVFFGSLSGVTGNIGQSAYGPANAFLGAFSARRQHLCKQGKRSGQTLTIQWPYWESGGMRMPVERVNELRELGLYPLPTDQGLTVLFEALSVGPGSCALLYGTLDAIEGIHSVLKRIEGDTLLEDGEVLELGDSERDMLLEDEDGLESGASDCEALVKNAFVSLLKIPLDQLDNELSLEQLGMDSILWIQLIEELEVKGIEVDRGALLLSSTLQELMTTLRLSSPVVDSITVGDPKSQSGDEAIAIIGVSGRFPGASSIQTYWDMLSQAKEASSYHPERWAFLGASDYSEKRTCFLNDISGFDAAFFGLSSEEALMMCPQQRLLLELAQEVVDHSGYDAEEIKGSRTGVFVGASESYYMTHFSDILSGLTSGKGLANGIAPMMSARISHFFDFKGPSQMIDTSCSSSLVAVHEACEKLRQGDIDAALAGGIFLMVEPTLYQRFQESGVLSPSNTLSAFSQQANGILLGEGGGLVSLKRLSDAQRDGDRIYAVIQTGGVNHDGYTVGLTTPNVTSQETLLREIYRSVECSQVAYIEAHGTGTQLGDAIEFQALSRVFSGKEKLVQSCGLGSVKSSIGHLLAGSGIASLIKVVLSMSHREIVPMRVEGSVHKSLMIHQSPFYRVETSQSWPASKPYAGVSSFGFSGTNVHLLLRLYEGSLVSAKKPISRTFSRRSFWPGLETKKKLFEQSFTITFSGADQAISSHIIDGQKVVPGLLLLGAFAQSFLEMMSLPFTLSHFSWVSRLGIPDDHGVDVTYTISEQGDLSVTSQAVLLAQSSFSNDLALKRPFLDIKQKDVLSSVRVKEVLHTTALGQGSDPSFSLCLGYDKDCFCHWETPVVDIKQLFIDLALALLCYQVKRQLPIDFLPVSIKKCQLFSVDVSISYAVITESTVSNNGIMYTISFFDADKHNVCEMDDIHCVRPFSPGLVTSLQALLVEHVAKQDYLADVPLLEQGVSSEALIRLSNIIETSWEIPMYPTLFFEYPSLNEMADYLTKTYPELQGSRSAFKPSKQNVYSDSQANSVRDENNVIAHDSIAIIGIAGQFPGGVDHLNLWESLEKEAFQPCSFPDERSCLFSHLSSIKRERLTSVKGLFMTDILSFDPSFWKMDISLAQGLDPQFRRLLEVSYLSCEQAGIQERLRGSNTGVFVASCNQDFQQFSLSQQAHSSDSETPFTTSFPFYLSNGLSHYLDLTGPSLTVDTACSSSLTALHLACQSLRSGECQQAIVGSVNLILNPLMFLGLDEMSVLSKQHQARPFDAAADGYIRSEAVLSMVLKPYKQALKDGDPIHGLILGSGVSHGGKAASLSAPKKSEQARLLKQVWASAAIDPSELDYIEAHGSSTLLGDSIEILALKEAFL